MPDTPLDLDALERAARVMMEADERWYASQIVLGTYRAATADYAHRVSPAAVLALCERVRELEAGLRDVLRDANGALAIHHRADLDYPRLRATVARLSSLLSPPGAAP